jgi:membrane fusion protein (multidrug efflux system)
MSKKKILGFSLFLLLLVILILFKVVQCSSRHSDTPDQSAVSVILPVEACVVSDTSVISVVETIGSLRANEEVEVVSELNEKLVGIFLEEGSYVEKGQLLFKLDDSEIAAEMNTLRVEEDLAAANESREKALLGKGGVSQEDYDVAANRLNVIRARIAALEVELEKTEIRAPFAGKAGLRTVSVGAWVTPALPLVSLQDIHVLKVLFDVPERYSGAVKTGQKVKVTADFYTEEFEAVVEASEPAVDPRTRTLKVEAILYNPDVKLVPGSSVKVELELYTEGNTLFVPTEALIPSQQGYSVFVVREGKATNVPVTTGLRTPAMVQILDNLTKGDTIITTNLLRVRPGMQVMIQKTH